MEVKTVPAHHEAQDGLQQDQNGKSFIYFNVISFSLGVGNNQCYLLVVLPGIASGIHLSLAMQNALNHGTLLCSTNVSYLYLYCFLFKIYIFTILIILFLPLYRTS